MILPIPSLSGTFAFISIFLVMGIGLAGEVAVDLTTKAPRIYKSDETVASADPDANGQGVQLNFDFESGGITARYEYLLSPPIDGPISKFHITAKGSEGPIILLVRDARSKGVGYELGPITAYEQTFTVDLANPASNEGRQTVLEYPLKAIGFSIKKSSEIKGSIEIMKIVAENAD